MTSVHTEFGPGRIVASETVRGRTQYKVAGDGFEMWVDATKVAAIPGQRDMARNPGFREMADEYDDPYALDGVSLGLTPDQVQEAADYPSMADFESGRGYDYGDLIDPDEADELDYERRFLIDGPDWSRFPGTEHRDEFDDDESGLIYARRHGYAPLDDSNSVALPYNPAPQYPAVPGDTESTIQPIHRIDADERLSPVDSITFDPAGTDESIAVGDRPNFIESRHHQANPALLLPLAEEALPALARGVGMGVATHALSGHGDDEGGGGGEDAGGMVDGFLDSVRLPGGFNPMAAHRPAGLSDRYADITPEGDYYSREAQFRHDPHGFIHRVGHAMTAGHDDPEMESYANLVEANRQIREAAWKDVRAKAMRLRREGRVRIKEITAEAIYTAVKGDHGDYEAMIYKRGAFGGPIGQSAETWTCSCPWGKWAFKRKSKFGRFCSHAYASYLEMQSAHATGKPVTRRQTKLPRVRRQGGLDDFFRDVDNAYADPMGDAHDVELQALDAAYPGGYTDSREGWQQHLKDKDAYDDAWRDAVWQQQLDALYRGAGVRHADALPGGPHRLVPDFFVNDTADEHLLVDVTDDDRETTGPDGIVHFSHYRYADGVDTSAVGGGQSGFGTNPGQASWGVDTSAVSPGLPAGAAATPPTGNGAVDGVVSDSTGTADSTGLGGRTSRRRHVSHLNRTAGDGMTAAEAAILRQAAINRYADDQTPADWTVHDTGEAADALHEIRDWGERPQEDDFGDMADRVEAIRDAVDEARENGVDASYLVAGLRREADQSKDIWHVPGDVAHGLFVDTPRGIRDSISPGSSLNPLDLLPSGGYQGYDTADLVNRVNGESAPFGGGAGIFGDAPTAPPPSQSGQGGKSDTGSGNTGSGNAGNGNAGNGGSTGTGTGGSGGSAGSGGSGGNAGNGGSTDTGGVGEWKRNENANAIADDKYTIQSGDTLSDIAQRAGFGDNYQGLAKDLGIADPNMIRAGDELDFTKAQGRDLTKSKPIGTGSPLELDDQGKAVSPSGKAGTPDLTDVPSLGGQGWNKSLSDLATSVGDTGAAQISESLHPGSTTPGASGTAGSPAPGTGKANPAAAPAKPSDLASSFQQLLGDPAGKIGDAMGNAGSIFGGSPSEIATGLNNATKPPQQAPPKTGGYLTAAQIEAADYGNADYFPDLHPHHPFAGSGWPGDLEFGSSKDYVDEHERPRFVDVTDLNDSTGFVTGEPHRTGGIRRHGKTPRPVTPEVVREQRPNRVAAAPASRFDDDYDPLAPRTAASFLDPEDGMDSRTAGADENDIVAAFQRSASAGGTALDTSSGGHFDGDISGAAQAFLRTAGRHYSLAEQDELVNERHALGARNLGDLDLRDTHYENGI